MPGTLSDDLFETSCASTHIFYFVFRVESLDAELAAKMQEIKRCVSVRVCACVRACTCSCECESSDESAHAHIKRAGSRARVRAGRERERACRHTGTITSYAE